VGSVLDLVAQYYSGKLAEHGPTPRGVDWNSPESQELRFAQLLRICESDRDGSVNDFGCGYGALAGWMRAQGFNGDYCGYDISPAMVAAALSMNQSLARCRFTHRSTELRPAAYTLASGIFNVKLDTPIAEWEEHVRDALNRLRALSTEGFAFNVLTAHADPPRMRPDLYYADPATWLDYCLRTFSRHVALLHDYPLYEFTVLVRLKGGR
jgi:SAM-dependent methyltransferase